ncbi:unnamed protein product [Prorocentrum cordatum]|uniref:Palmitoyltransferase n=1 Tax=Prorocentrum cordatum TaxID=2364126 RepID=A0ABN9PXY1_9DINO|nr:unnamed protein product [Polarella glacialis]
MLLFLFPWWLLVILLLLLLYVLVLLHVRLPPLSRRAGQASSPCGRCDCCCAPRSLASGGASAVATAASMQRLCTTTWVFKGPRTKYCKNTGACVDEFDHWCVWLNNSVGRGNHRPFVCLAAVEVSTQYCHLLLCFVVLRSSLQLEGAGPLTWFSIVATNQPITLLVCMVQCLTAPMIHILVTQQLFYVAVNKTTNEAINAKRYGLIRAMRSSPEPEFLHPDLEPDVEPYLVVSYVRLVTVIVSIVFVVRGMARACRSRGPVAELPASPLPTKSRGPAAERGADMADLGERERALGVRAALRAAAEVEKPPLVISLAQLLGPPAGEGAAGSPGRPAARGDAAAAAAPPLASPPPGLRTALRSRAPAFVPGGRPQLVRKDTETSSRLHARHASRCCRRATSACSRSSDGGSEASLARGAKAAA